MNITTHSPHQQMIYAKRLVYDLLRRLLDTPFYSQATQDIFVTKILSEKKQGFFLEVGGGHPFDSNNTYLLESGYDWNGLSLEFDKSLVELYNSTRRTRAILADATCYDYQSRLASMNAPKQIDYLSIDIDPAENTYKALLKIPHNLYRFSVITYEHDRYQIGDEFMELSRSFLKNLGYQLVVSNLRVFGKDFEDWWIDSSAISPEVWSAFKQDGIEFSSLWLQ